MIDLAAIATASVETLTKELAEAGWFSKPFNEAATRREVALLVYVSQGPLNLCDSETKKVIRKANADETVAFALGGFVVVDGRRCYVTN